MDFCREEPQEVKKLKQKDYRELRRIVEGPERILESYLFERLLPFVLPFYSKNMKQEERGYI